MSRAQIFEQVKPGWKPSAAGWWLILVCSKTKRGMTPRPVSMHRWMKADRNGSSRTCGRPSSRHGWSAASRMSRSISPASRTYMWCTPTSGTTPESTPCSRAAGETRVLPSVISSQAAIWRTRWHRSKSKGSAFSKVSSSCCQKLHWADVWWPPRCDAELFYQQTSSRAKLNAKTNSHISC